MKLLFPSSLIALVVLTCSAAPQPSLAALGADDTRSKVLAEKARVFNTLAKDFLAISKAQRKDLPNFETALNLAATTTRTSDYLFAASSLLFVYDNISSRTDRKMISPFIMETLESYAKSLELSAEEANLLAAYTDIPGIATSAVRLKDEIRASVVLLRSINLR